MNKFETISKDDEQISILEVKKSKFIAKVYYIDSTEMAEALIQKTRNEYKDARHIVYAYMLKSTGKFSDDKEPQGTAGKPIYSLLQKENLINVLIVVIRYFGGILLGAGPLTRAYGTVAKEALTKCKRIQHVEYENKKLICQYNEEESVKRDLLSLGCIIQRIIRTEKVQIEYLQPKKSID